MTVIEHEARTEDELVLGSNEPDPTSVARLRHRIVEWLTERDVPAETCIAVELVASELMTNAVRHAGTGYAVTLLRGIDIIELRVFDENPSLPTAVLADDEATGGRGLYLVSILTRAWGACADAWHGTTGKTVWARFDLAS